MTGAACVIPRLSRHGSSVTCFESLATCFQSRGFLGRSRKRARGFETRDFRLVVAENLAQHLLGMLAEQWRALDHRRRGGELDRHTDVEPFASLRMVDLDPHF